MKFIQTLYFNKTINPFNHHFGWAAPEYHLMGWALSCLQLKKMYGYVDLYCNSIAAELLIDKLALPYNNVYITHDNLKIADEKLWALPKVFTYGLQEEPFLHVDGDVFLFEKLPDILLKSELIAQNVEEATNYYLDTQNELMKYFTYFPNCVANDFNSSSPIKAVNAGVLGSNNIEFIKEYTNLAFEYIRRNVQHFSSLNVDKFNVFFEQHLFYSLAKEREIPINVLIKDTIMDNQYQHLGDFHEVPCKNNYLHLLGHYKRDEYTCRQMALKLKELYPEYYFRILSLFKRKKIAVSDALSTDLKFESLFDYKTFSDKAKDNYRDSLDDAKWEHFEKVNLKNQEIKSLNFFRDYIHKIETTTNFSKQILKKDFNLFTRNLSKAINRQLGFKRKYLHGRDLETNSWYCQVFCDDKSIRNKIIVRCKEVDIIHSKFDWGGLLNKHTRIGVRYYELLELNIGQFYNLVVPELFGDKFSLHDIDEMEQIILEHLKEPISIEILFKQMQVYIENDIVENHLAEYENLIITMLKQLVVKKAVRPFNNKVSHN
ncbi:DUF6734 family protein [Ferruginibacter sp. SUN106]|uniref:DUF6734 family protein n=1 Tax=Ferruginibacter sp. SUN106 TaxID=2978348 RepID=UPI003D360632